MKKYITLTFILLLSIVACNKNDIFVPESHENREGMITFGVKENPTKTTVAESNLDALKDYGFNITAILEDHSTYFDETATWSMKDNIFYTTNTYYFPASGTVSFYGIYPSSEFITITDGVATLEYFSDGESDVVVSKAESVAKQNTAVNLAFEHILSQAEVQCKGNDDELTFKVKSIKIVGNQDGTYAFSSNSWTPSPGRTPRVYFEGTKTVSSSSMTQFIDETTGSAMCNTLIPGTFDMVIEWEVYSGSDKVGDYTGANAKSVPVTFEKGKKTTIKATLFNSGASQIQFTASVEEWGEAAQTLEFGLNIPV